MLPPIKLCLSKSDQQKAKNPKSRPNVKMLSPIMLCASKSGQQKSKKHEIVPKAKASFNRWLDLPSDLMINILRRIGVIDILDNAQRVCTTWRKICKEPAMWRVIDMGTVSAAELYNIGQFKKMCKNAVDRSQGQLTDISIIGFGSNELLMYIADRSRHLRRLEIAYCFHGLDRSWVEALKKFPALEELSLQDTGINKEAIETIGRHCPLLKIFKLNQYPPSYVYNDSPNVLSIAIGTNLRELRHLELIGSTMTNTELEVILGGCCHLESLDMRNCCNVNLKADLGKRCSRQIKNLKLPEDSLDGCPYIIEITRADIEGAWEDVRRHYEANRHVFDDDEFWFNYYMEEFGTNPP